MTIADYLWWRTWRPEWADGHCVTLVSDISADSLIGSLGADAVAQVSGIDALDRRIVEPWDGSYDPSLQMIGAADIADGWVRKPLHLRRSGQLLGGPNRVRLCSRRPVDNRAGHHRLNPTWEGWATVSILDFTTGLFREPASLQAFVDDPEQALKDAGLPDATPEQVHDLLPVVAESMPADHPLQAVVYAPDPIAALLDLDIAELAAAVHRHSPAEIPDKSVGQPAADEVISIDDIECTPVESDDIVDSAKALDGVDDDPLTPETEGDLASTDDYDALSMEDLADPDFSPAAWGKETE